MGSQEETVVPGVHNILLYEKRSATNIHSKVVGSVEAETEEEQPHLTDLIGGLLQTVTNVVPSSLGMGALKAIPAEKYNIIPYIGENVVGYIFVDPDYPTENAREAISVIVDIFEKEFKEELSNWTCEVGEEVFPFNSIIQNKVREAVVHYLHDEANFWRSQIQPFFEPYQRLQKIVGHKMTEISSIFYPKIKFNPTGKGVVREGMETTLPHLVVDYWQKPISTKGVKVNGDLMEPDDVLDFHVPNPRHDFLNWLRYNTNPSVEKIKESDYEKILERFWKGEIEDAKTELRRFFDLQSPDLSIEGQIETLNRDYDERLFNPLVLYSYGILGEGDSRSKGFRYREVPLQGLYEHFSNIFSNLKENIPDPESLFVQIHDISLDTFSRFYEHYSTHCRNPNAKTRAQTNLLKSVSIFSIENIEEVIKIGITRKRIDELLKLKIKEEDLYVPISSNPDIWDYMEETANARQKIGTYQADKYTIELIYDALSFLAKGVEDDKIKQIVGKEKEFSELRNDVLNLYKKVEKDKIYQSLSKDQLTESELEKIYHYLPKIMSSHEANLGVLDRAKEFIENKKYELSNHRLSIASDQFARNQPGLLNIISCIEEFTNNYSILDS